MIFIVDYTDCQGQSHSFDLAAESYDEAEARLEAIRKSAVLIGELIERGDTPKTRMQ